MNHIDPSLRFDAIQLVKDFLGAMERREIEQARTYLADNFVMTFPGGARFQRLEQLIEWAKPRYRFVRKSYERFDQASSGDGDIVVCFGTLSGEWPDGTAFSGIRFCDWFLASDGKLVRQEVWNDIATVSR